MRATFCLKKGQPGDSMVLVLEGKIDVRVGDKVVETAGLYDILGEMALLDAAPRSATAKAATAGEVAVIDRQTFLDLVRENPAFSLYVMRRMAARIRRMNDET
jgi:CRP/FNR family transcriptional regulator, cyclic AMP receptor protein